MLLAGTVFTAFLPSPRASMNCERLAALLTAGSGGAIPGLETTFDIPATNPKPRISPRTPSIKCVADVTKEDPKNVAVRGTAVTALNDPDPESVLAI
jgi:hypothetical protein